MELVAETATTAGGRAASITVNAAGSSWKAAIHAASTSSGAHRSPKRPLIPARTPSASNSPLSAASTNPLPYTRAATSPDESPHNRPNATSLGWRSNTASTPARSINKCVGATTHTILKTNAAHSDKRNRPSRRHSPRDGGYPLVAGSPAVVGRDDNPLVAGLFNNPYAAGTAQM